MSASVAGDGRGVASASRPPAARWLLGLSGAGLMASVFLPWLTLFAGLRSFGGLTGPTGVVVLLAGAWLVVAALEERPAARAAWVVAAVAVAWSVTGIVELRQSPTQRMLVPGVGAGIWLAGACLALALPAAWQARRRVGRSPARRPEGAWTSGPSLLR